jgi:hypothetical protein
LMSERGFSTSWSIHRAAREASGCSVSAAWGRRASCSRKRGGRRRIATLPLMPPLLRVDRPIIYSSEGEAVAVGSASNDGMSMA